MRRLVSWSIMLWLAAPSSLSAHPWHLEVTEVREAWKITQGKNVVVTVVDSPVCFVGPLEKKSADGTGGCPWEVYDKLTFKKNYGHVITSLPGKSAFEAYKEVYAHGTAMASIIAADKKELNGEGSQEEVLLVAGIAPEALLKTAPFKYVSLTSSSHEKSLRSVLEEVLQKIEQLEADFAAKVKQTRHNKPHIKLGNPLESRVYIVNISAGFIGEDNRQEYLQLLRKVASKGYIQFIMAVGNESEDLVAYCQDVGLYPTCVRDIPQPDNLHEAEDSFIRVGALGMYSSSQPPKEGNFSNYSPNYVDIFAPGEDIPALFPCGRGNWVKGTSPATAIVTAATTLLASCDPLAKAVTLKKALMENADGYKHLEPYVRKGQVLNVYRSVAKFCYDEEEIPAYLAT